MNDNHNAGTIHFGLDKKLYIAVGDNYTSMNDFRIGGRQVASQIFQGKIDEVRVYNFALGANEVAALAQ